MHRFTGGMDYRYGAVKRHKIVISLIDRIRPVFNARNRQISQPSCADPASASSVLDDAPTRCLPLPAHRRVRVEIVTALAGVLLLLNWSAVRVPHASCRMPHLPGFHIGLVSFYGNSVPGDLLVDYGLRKLTNNSELIAEITIDGLKPFRQFDDRVSIRVVTIFPL